MVEEVVPGEENEVDKEENEVVSFVMLLSRRTTCA